MRWFTARDMANGGIEERDAVLDEIRPLIAARTSRPRRGRRWSRLDAPENQALFSFVSKCVNSSSSSRTGAFGNNAFLSRTA